MHRSGALKLLVAHRGLPLSREEAVAVSETISFVEAHPDCLLRSCLPGHLTGSAWILSPDRRKTLLTHHGKLGKWLQLGGHADGDPDLLAVALREAREESGLARIRVVDGRLFEADPLEPLTLSDESRALAWVDVASVPDLNPEESMARMVRKTLGAP
jgi:8-oxo-dGTP pyrophosphatase MutT (NUDIX family)